MSRYQHPDTVQRRGEMSHYQPPTPSSDSPSDSFLPSVREGMGGRRWEG